MTIKSNLDIAIAGMRDWANWKAGYHAGKGEVPFDVHQATYELECCEHRTPALIEWLFRWVPEYAQLRNDQIRWLKFRHQARLWFRERARYPDQQVSAHERLYHELTG